MHFKSGPAGWWGCSFLVDEHKNTPIALWREMRGMESIYVGIQTFKKLGKTWRGILIVEGNLSGSALLIVRDSGKFTGVMENSHATIQIHRFHKIGQFLYKLIS